MTNDSFISQWVKNPKSNTRNQRLSVPSNPTILLSYAKPIAKRAFSRVLISSERYAKTTSCHVSPVAKHARQNGLKVFAIPLPLSYVEVYYTVWTDLAKKLAGLGANGQAVDECCGHFLRLAALPHESPTDLAATVLNHFLTLEKVYA